MIDHVGIYGSGVAEGLSAFSVGLVQARVTKFGTQVGRNMVINISSGFFHSRQKKILAIFFRIFQLRTWKITVNTLTSIIFHGSFSNLVRTFITLRSRTSSMMEVLPH